MSVSNDGVNSVPSSKFKPSLKINSPDPYLKIWEIFWCMLAQAKKCDHKVDI
jgi:hypothetical protein